MTVIAMPPTNSILDPSPVTIGRKEKTVVAVAAANGAHKFFSPCEIESLIFNPDALLFL